jgi:hypothetical protein
MPILDWLLIYFTGTQDTSTSIERALVHLQYSVHSFGVQRDPVQIISRRGLTHVCPNGIVLSLGASSEAADIDGLTSALTYMVALRCNNLQGVLYM